MIAFSPSQDGSTSRVAGAGAVAVAVAVAAAVAVENTVHLASAASPEFNRVVYVLSDDWLALGQARPSAAGHMREDCFTLNGMHS